MKCLKLMLSLLFLVAGLTAFPQAGAGNAITSEWTTITMGKLQRKPLFKEPAISVRFVSEEGFRFMHISLKYMFADEVFEEAVPVEYYKNESIEFATGRTTHELKAAKYSKARRMNAEAQKTAEMKVLFSGDLSFLSADPVKSLTVHYAQGSQTIKLSAGEAALIKEAYGKFLSILPKAAPVSRQKPQQNVSADGGEQPAKSDTIQPVRHSLDKLRQQARQWK